MRRGVLGLAGLALGALALGAAAWPQGSAARSTAAPAAPRIADTILSPARAQRVLANAAQYWGGEYRTAAGETVRIFASASYPEDHPSNQRWADFLGSLVHGRELATVTMLLAPLAEVESTCGPRALACYSPRRSLIVAPRETEPGDASPEAIIAHEYGHHVATSRNNAPWSARSWGTKRWASYMQICRRERAGDVHPGGQGPTTYPLNPGEAYAEAYRVLNERRLGRTETLWAIVAPIFYPDATALRLLERDIVEPWTRPTSSAFSGAARPSRTYAIATPLDGSLRLTLHASTRSSLALTILTPRGTRLARAVKPRGSSTRTVATTICGDRTLRVRVTRLSGPARFSLAVSKP